MVFTHKPETIRDSKTVFSVIFSIKWGAGRSYCISNEMSLTKVIKDAIERLFIEHGRSKPCWRYFEAVYFVYTKIQEEKIVCTNEWARIKIIRKYIIYP